MKQANLTELRNNLSSMLNAVNNDHEPLMVTRRRGKPVVMISLEDYEALEKRLSRQSPRSQTVDKLLNSLVEVDEITFMSDASADLEMIGRDQDRAPGCPPLSARLNRQNFT